MREHQDVKAGAPYTPPKSALGSFSLCVLKPLAATFFSKEEVKTPQHLLEHVAAQVNNNRDGIDSKIARRIILQAKSGPERIPMVRFAEVAGCRSGHFYDWIKTSKDCKDAERVVYWMKTGKVL